MTESTDDRSAGKAATAEPGDRANRVGRSGDGAPGDVARPTPAPRSLAEALDVDPDRDDVKG